MNFGITGVKLSSYWFDDNGKILKITNDQFKLYLNLFKFYIPNQIREYTFITSISLLHKELGGKYSKKEIRSMLRSLERLDIIKSSTNDWYRLDYNKAIVIEAIDVPQTYRDINNVNRLSNFENYYIPIDLKLIQHYYELGLNTNHVLLYCILLRYSNNNEGKAWISIFKIANRLGVHFNTVNKLIWDLNEKYLLYSDKRARNEARDYFEHKICKTYKGLPEFQKNFSNLIDKSLRKRKNQKKNKNNNKQKEQFNKV